MLDLFLVLVSHRGPQRPQLSPRPCACNLCQSPPFSLYGQGEGLGEFCPGCHRASQDADRIGLRGCLLTQPDPLFLPRSCCLESPWDSDEAGHAGGQGADCS